MKQNLAPGADDYWAKFRQGEARLYDTPESRAFEAKFAIKKTTDDCFTPPEVYAVILDWVVREYGLGGGRIVRPFFPGGDYKKEKYPEGCVVVDNPPFSILSSIVRWYQARKVNFFLFAPGLTLFTAPESGCCYIASGAHIEYENGARVPTGFLTNLGGPRLRTAPDLYKAIKTASEAVTKKQSVKRPKKVRAYPSNLITAALLGKLAKHGIGWSSDVVEYVRKLDMMEGAIYGGGWLVGNKARRQLEEISKSKLSEREKKVVIKLSEREKKVVIKLSEREGEERWC